MSWLLLPLRTYLFQLLFLLIAIATESFVLQRGLGLTRRVSLEYAISLNLFSTVIGWLVFYEFQALLPGDLRGQIISYILADRFLTSTWEPGTNTFLILAGLLTFLGTFIIESRALSLLELLRQEQKPEKTNEPLSARERRRLAWIRVQDTPPEIRNRAITVLLANAASYGVILIVLLVRLIGR